MRTIPNRTHLQTIAQSARHLHTSHVTRRDALRLLGGGSLALAGLSTLGRQITFAQEGGTPAAVVTPQIGAQSDGSTMWRVKVGEMDMAEQVEFHAFFPEEITIAAGDSIWFDFGMGGFHTASFLSGGEMPEIFVPDPDAGTPVANGAAKLMINPAYIFPQGSDTYDGTGFVSSGLDVFRDPSQPYVVRFTTPGTYDYLCLVHALVMKARVVVQESADGLSQTQADYDQMTAETIETLRKEAMAVKEQYAEATSTQNADGTTTWEATAGAGGETHVRIMAFLPAELEIKVGDTVRWVNRSLGEPHTVSFIGEGEVPPEDISVEVGADGTPKFIQSPLTLFPQGGNVWDGTGWLNSGFFGFMPGEPTEFEVTFPVAGDYIYYCALHGDSQGNGMAARLKVSEG